MLGVWFYIQEEGGHHDPSNIWAAANYCSRCYQMGGEWFILLLAWGPLDALISMCAVAAIPQTCQINVSFVVQLKTSKRHRQ